jgi:hypothetical protein
MERIYLKLELNIVIQLQSKLIIYKYMFTIQSSKQSINFSVQFLIHIFGFPL